MELTARRIRNPELVTAVLSEVYEAVAEDNSPHPSTVQLDLERTPVVALTNGFDVHGLIAVTPFSLNVARVQVAIRPDYYGDGHNIELTRRGLQECQEIMNVPRLIMLVPVPDKEALRFAQRAGFQREGVMRSSFLRDGVLLDQYLVGITA